MGLVDSFGTAVGGGVGNEVVRRVSQQAGGFPGMVDPREATMMAQASIEAARAVKASWWLPAGVLATVVVAYWAFNKKW